MLCMQLIGNLVLVLGLLVAAVTGSALAGLLQFGPGLLFVSVYLQCLFLSVKCQCT